MALSAGWPTPAPGAAAPGPSSSSSGGGAGGHHPAKAAFEQLASALGVGAGGSLCIKPRGDGCSTGVARLTCWQDLAAYGAAVRDALPRIPAHALPGGPHPAIEMPVPPSAEALLEPFIETDVIRIVRRPDGGEQLAWEGKSRWVEVTVGVVGPAGRMRALSPSVTVRESGDVLSLEEKFQGGTGVNLTPPPEEIMPCRSLEAVKAGIELAAAALGMRGFGRIDAFANVDTGAVMVIEANTVPGMTPSTVLYHQGLAEKPPLPPGQLLARFVHLAAEA